jgi:hypothetical protein
MNVRFGSGILAAAVLLIACSSGGGHASPTTINQSPTGNVTYPAAPTTTTPPLRTNIGLPVRPSGIDANSHDGPFSSYSFGVSNSWQGPVGKRWYLVFAGELEPHTKRQAAIRIYTEPLELPSHGAVPTLVRDVTFNGASSVAIAAVNGPLLKLRDQRTGAGYQFDLAGLASRR